MCYRYRLISLCLPNFLLRFKKAISLVRNDERMKNFVGICIFCFVFLTTANAQMVQSIVPQTSKLSANLFGKVSQIVLPPFSKEEADQLDYNDLKNGHLPIMARNIA